MTYQQYRLKVGWRRLSDRTSTSERTRDSLVHGDVTYKMRKAKGNICIGKAIREIRRSSQQRAYWLYEASVFEEGRALEHWLEAERQVTGSAQRQSDPPSTGQS